jgi:hypothetical protein
MAMFIDQSANPARIPVRNIELKRFEESPEKRANIDQNVKPQITAL